MKLLTTLAFLLAAGQAAAFDLPAVGLADVAERGAQAPAAAAQKAGEPTAETAFATIKDYYNSQLSFPPAESDLAGAWEGRIFMRDPQGYLEPQPIQITFSQKVLPSELGPLFQEDKAETYVQFPYFEGLLERKVSFGPAGASFQFRWEGLFTVSFRKLFRGNEPVLVMKSDCYTGDTYAYFMKKKPAAKQAYTGALPAGDLFGPLPPYFHGQLPPLQVNGQAVQGAYEYSNRIIFYRELAQAQAAAEKAAAALSAAGLQVLSVKAEELNGFYYTSVGFAGKRGILYRWDDDATTAEEAAEIIKRKTGRYASEGYTILETNINKAGDKHFFFIMCAKFF